MTAPVNPTPIVSYAGSLPDPSDPTTYGTRGRAVWAWETGDFFSGINLASSQAYTNAVSANESATIASATAAYKGNWSSLSGALSVPSTVSHEDSIWMLLSSTSDVTSIEPGVSAQWMNVTPITASNGSFGGQRNRILNGDMRIAQYGAVYTPVNISSGTSETNVVDGWVYRNGCSAEISIGRSDGLSPDGRSVKWLTATVNTADTSIGVDDYSFLLTRIEGYEVSDLVGRTFTISGIIKSSVTGVHSLEVGNGAKDRYYIAEINISASNTPQSFSVTVVGGLPSGGTWDFDRGVGLEVGFILAAGSNNFGSVGSWQTNSEISSSSQVNALATVGNVFGVTEVRLELGSVALPFERLSIDAALARCQRRYKKIPLFISGYGVAGSICSQTVSFGPELLTNLAALSQLSPVFTNCSANALTPLSGAMGGCAAFVRSVTVTSTGNFSHNGTVVLDARL